MAEEIAFENRISNFERLVTLTLDWVILHTVVHTHLLTCRISLKSEKRFVDGRTSIHMDERTDGLTFETHLISSTQKSRPKNASFNTSLVKAAKFSNNLVFSVSKCSAFA